MATATATTKPKSNATNTGSAIQNLNMLNQLNKATQPNTQVTTTQAAQPQQTSISQNTMNEIVKKATKGIPLVKPTAEKQAIYDRYVPKQQAVSPTQQPVQQGQLAPKPVAPSNMPTATQQNYVVPAYSFGTRVDPKYFSNAMGQHVYAGFDEPYEGFIGGTYAAGSIMKPSDVMEIAYYLQEKDKAINEVGSLMESINRDGNLAGNHTGIQDAYRRYYAIEDFMAQKWGVNGYSDNLTEGLGRADLGLYDPATISDVNGNKLLNPWNHVASSDYFNAPFNQGEQFGWMNVVDPSALGQNYHAQNRDYTSLDYYYLTEMAGAYGGDDIRNMVNYGDKIDYAHYIPYIDKTLENTTDTLGNGYIPFLEYLYNMRNQANMIGTMPQLGNALQNVQNNVDYNGNPIPVAVPYTTDLYRLFQQYAGR